MVWGFKIAGLGMHPYTRGPKFHLQLLLHSVQISYPKKC